MECPCAAPLYPQILLATIVALLIVLPQDGQAQWKLGSGETIQSNLATTLTLVSKETEGPVGSKQLWLRSDSPDLLLPPVVSYAGGRAAVPVFARGPMSSEIVLFDSGTKTTSVIALKAVPSIDEQPMWLPRLTVQGEDDLPVVYANQVVTATLTLAPGAGPMPPVTHIEAKDHRGRTVFSRFYNTFDLVASQDSIRMPAPGHYDLNVCLIQDSLTSLPRALEPDPIPIPYGKTKADLDEPDHVPDGVTTDTVLGMRLAFEQIPTTATVAGRDRLSVTVLGVPSLEIQRNKWPFVVIGADLINMPRAEITEKGAKLLRWQRRLGSSFARMELEWGDVQKSPGMVSWSALNATLPVYRQNLVRPLLTVKGRSAWSNQYPTETSQTLDAWVGFIRQISDNQMKLIWGLQCWEHPETVWKNPEDYLSLLDGTLNGFQLKRGQRIPAAAVVGGNTKEFDAGYLGALLTSTTAGRLNGISFGLYPKDKSASPKANGFGEALDQAAALLKEKNAEDMQLWISGAGWPVGPDGIAPELQANYLLRTHVMALAHGAYKIYWDNLINKPDHAWQTGSTSHMGLLGTDFVPNLSGAAYNIMTYMLSGVTPAGTTKEGKADIYAFNIPLQRNKWPGILYVAWTESPEQVQTIRLDMKQGGGVYAFDYLGAEIQTTRISDGADEQITGSYTVPIGYEPVFIWDAGKPSR